MSSTDSKVAKLQTHFHALSKLASSLNTASDELRETVASLDESLKRLNVGISAWVKFQSRDDDTEPESYDEDQIGYAKVNGTWGIALRRVWGDPTRDYHNEVGPFLFNDASREMRLQSVDHIPELIEALAREAFNTTKKIEEKNKTLRELAEAIAPVTGDGANGRGR
jgi:prefoldin subunit 5